MTAGELLREARRGAGLTQRELAARAGTSQAAIAAIERDRKAPTFPTLERLLAAAGAALVLTESPTAVMLRRGRRLQEALGLAEALPFRREGGLCFPRVPS